MTKEQILTAIGNMKLSLPSDDYVEVKVCDLELLYNHINKNKLRISNDRLMLSARDETIAKLKEDIKQLNEMVKCCKLKPSLDSYA